jgi:hypothetical protein
MVDLGSFAAVTVSAGIIQVKATIVSTARAAITVFISIFSLQSLASSVLYLKEIPWPDGCQIFPGSGSTSLSN